MAADVTSGGAGASAASVEAAIAAFKQHSGRQVLTLVGYSGAGYEDPAAMLQAVGDILAGSSPEQVVINIGATAEGIGAAYALAKQRGFITMGIVSTQAQAAQVPLSPWVDQVFFVPDDTWGGLDAQGRLSPTSQAIVSVSDALVGIGGGEVARDELLAARRLGKPVRFVPAEMNHQGAIDRARARQQPLPDDFCGAAHHALAQDAVSWPAAGHAAPP